MAIVMQMLADQVTDQSGYSYLGELRVGANGYPDGTPEIDSGAATSDPATQHVTWDSNPQTHIDSGWRNVSFDLSGVTGAETLVVDGGTQSAATAEYGGAQFNAITQIRIRSDVWAQAAMEWNNLQISFYDSSGNVVDSAAFNAGPTVDLSSQDGGGTAEDLFIITPDTQSTVTAVKVTGQVRMSSADWVYPVDNDIFSQVLVYTS